MNRGLLFIISIIFVITAALSGCDKGATTTKARTAPTSITMNSTTTKTPVQAFTLSLRHTLMKDTSDKQLSMLKDIVAATEQSVPGLKIVLEGVDENINRTERLPAEMAEGNPPEIFDLFGGEADAWAYAKANRLLDLKPILEELGKQYDFANLEAFTVDGRIVGLPVTGQAEGVFYNKKIFADLGVQPPKTYAEFLDICEKVKAKGITPIALASSDAWVPTMLINTLLVRSASVDKLAGLVSGTAKWTDPLIADAFVQLEELVTKGYLQEGNLNFKYMEQQNQFKAGKAAMMFDGSWAYPALIDPEYSLIAKDAGFFSFPDMGGLGDGLINGSYAHGYGFSNKLTDLQKEAVKQFIKLMFNDEKQKRQLTEESLLPSMFLLDNTGVQPLVTDITAAVKDARGTFTSPDKMMKKKVKEALEDGLQQLLGGKTTVKKLTETLQKIQDSASFE
jgi:raffinose/stachyose/melibiose transport system substrate-binding protein